MQHTRRNIGVKLINKRKRWLLRALCYAERHATTRNTPEKWGQQLVKLQIVFAVIASCRKAFASQTRLKSGWQGKRLRLYSQDQFTNTGASFYCSLQRDAPEELQTDAPGNSGERVLKNSSLITSLPFIHISREDSSRFEWVRLEG